MATANEIRSTFLNYFGDREHEIVSSSSLVPRNDPTLMFTNAGMVQFKNLFLGQEQRAYNRAVTSQKCVRAGGKHNDLENVGYTARHHTFFEMLGNFSFGDYFKDVAIENAWNLITREYGLPADKLLVTVYHTDDEAVQLWKKVAGLSDDRIIRIDTSDNFWSMGDTGPCGPCSEIFYDHGDHIWGGPPGSPEEDGDRFIEIWNLVFMQFDKPEPGADMVPLPRPSIDTGMGLERISAILQGKHDNYDVDLLRKLIEASASASNDDPDGDNNVSHRVIADHLRSAAFLVADGVQPSNEGRGYVLRRIMRRGMRHAHKIGNKDPLMHRLVPTLVEAMGEHFTELRRAEASITEILRLEETRFKETLDRGLRLLGEETDRLGEGEALPGAVAFRLYDTFGFPLDLTADILRGQGRSVDQAGYDEALEAQRAAARASWKGSGEAATDTLWFEIREQVEASEFLGYSTLHAEGAVLALTKDAAQTQQLKTGDSGFLIANQTPFYAESGGQKGDRGEITTEAGARLRVLDTQKQLGDLWVHQVEVVEGEISVGDAVAFAVDPDHRAALAGHHSATHLLHEALRQRLGAHVAQKGSLVAADRLRFDFSHTAQVSEAELTDIEIAVNEEILANTAVETRIMSPDEAIEAGATALFGEKYGDEVRVVTMGTTDPASNQIYSMELCGGTHVRQTGDIGLLRIVREEGPASGVRRIEAVTGLAALEHVRRRDAQLEQAAAVLKTSPAALAERVEALSTERRQLEKELADVRKKLAAAGSGGGGQIGPEDISGTPVIARIIEDVPAKDLKGLADEFMGQIGSGVVALIGTEGGKASIVAAVGPDHQDRHNAVELVRAASAAVGGKGGGGRPDMAQAGGPDTAKAEAGIDAMRALIQDAG